MKHFVDCDTVERAEGIMARIYDTAGYTCKPAGDSWLKIVFQIAAEFVDQGLKFTPADLDTLTEDNAHDAVHAAEIIQHLSKYKLPERF